MLGVNLSQVSGLFWVMIGIPVFWIIKKIIWSWLEDRHFVMKETKLKGKI